MNLYYILGQLIVELRGCIDLNKTGVAGLTYPPSSVPRYN